MIAFASGSTASCGNQPGAAAGQLAAASDTCRGCHRFAFWRMEGAEFTSSPSTVVTSLSPLRQPRSHPCTRFADLVRLGRLALLHPGVRLLRSLQQRPPVQSAPLLRSLRPLPLPRLLRLLRLPRLLPVLPSAQVPPLLPLRRPLPVRRRLPSRRSLPGPRWGRWLLRLLVLPSDPDEPAAPVAPALPSAPVGPVAPVAPAAPVGSCGSGGPCAAFGSG